MFPVADAIDGLVVAIPISDRKPCQEIARRFAFIVVMIVGITSSKATKTSCAGGSVMVAG